MEGSRTTAGGHRCRSTPRRPGTAGPERSDRRPYPGTGRPSRTILRSRPLHPELEKHDIYSRGRFGGWKYEVSNQDHSLMQGVELVDRLVMGVPEVTYPFPGTANNMNYAKLA